VNKTFILTLIALTITACGTSTSQNKTIESSQLQEPIAETTPVSRIVPEVAPELDSTIKSAESTKPSSIETPRAVPRANPIVKSAAKPKNSTQEINPVTKSVDKPVNSTQKKVQQSAKATNNSEKSVSVDKLVANISSKIGCGEVDQKYKIQVATIAVANYNPQSLQGLSKKQIRQAVKKSIADYPERAEGLVAEYRSEYCTVAKNPTDVTTSIDNKQQVTASSNEVIPQQSGTCKELRARGIKNISVAANPWAKKKDRDNDGIACESK
jgi:hypothetical protein